MLSTKTRRKTISDNLINSETFTKIVNKVYTKLDNPYDISQMEIVKILLDMPISNEMISKVVNTILPNAKSTKGSIASLIKHIRNSNNLLEEFLSELD